MSQGPDQLPCDVRQVVEGVCANCHSSPVSAGATGSLTSRYDFLAPSSVAGETMGERSVARMKQAAAPMPPSVEPPLPAGYLDVLTKWVVAGMPAGACGAIPDKPAQTTCASGQRWDEEATPSKDMNPGLACRACHKTQASDFNYFFMGTVFPSFHEEDLCHSPPPSGAKVEILDESGAVTMTLTPTATGNFMSSAVAAGVPIPYRARLVADGLTRAMSSAQKDGDCNKCHSEQGLEGAPGRLVWPRSVDGPPLPSPPLITAVDPAGDALHVTWTASGCDKILIHRNEDGGAFALAHTLGGSETSLHDDSADSSAIVYCYRARCKVGVVTSADSNEVCGSP